MLVTLLLAITLDGRIGRTADHFPDWTEKEDKKLFAGLTRKAGVIIMGSSTFDTIGVPLPGRLNVVMTRDKTRVSRWDNLIFTDESPKAILDRLETRGFEEAVLIGGAIINSLFAEAELIDRVIVTVAPKIFGRGISLFTSEISMELELEETRRIGDNMVGLTYRVLKNR